MVPSVAGVGRHSRTPGLLYTIVFCDVWTDRGPLGPVGHVVGRVVVRGVWEQ